MNLSGKQIVTIVTVLDETVIKGRQADLLNSTRLALIAGAVKDQIVPATGGETAPRDIVELKPEQIDFAVQALKAVTVKGEEAHLIASALRALGVPQDQ